MPTPAMPTPAIAALLTCHNRKNLTLECLDRLYRQHGNSASFSLDIYLVDDGCSDGTAGAVAERFPAVNLITGDGKRFWNGGMRLAWESALAKRQYDFYLWVNDDTMIYPDAIASLMADYSRLARQGEKPGAITGTVVDPASKLPTYGGHTIKSRFNHLKVAIVLPSGTPQRCDFINGNIALVPAAAVQAIGILNPVFRHGYGDYDYSWRLQKAGLSCWTSSHIAGECMIDKKDYALETRRPVTERLRQVKNMERLYPYRDHMYFVRHCSGKFWPIWWAKAWLRGHFPLLWVLLTR